MEQAKLLSRIATNEDGSFIVLENDAIGAALLKGRRWEQHFSRLVQGLPLAGTMGVDVGANVGCNAVVMARALGQGGVLIAFEPQRIAYQQLCGNAILNGLLNVIAFNCALGDRNNVTLELEPVNYLAPFVNVGDTRLGAGGETVEMRTLDSFGLQNVSFIKIDVQGAELAVLQGAAESLRRNRPLIFIEAEEVHCKRFGHMPRDLLLTLLSAGYFLLHIQNEWPTDLLCFPQERRDQLSYYRSLIPHQTTCIESPEDLTPELLALLNPIYTGQ